MAWATSSLPVPLSPVISTRGVGRGDPFEPIDHLLHPVAGVDDPFEAEPFVQPLVQFDVLPPQPDRIGRPLGHGPQAGWA